MKYFLLISFIITSFSLSAEYSQYPSHPITHYTLLAHSQPHNPAPLPRNYNHSHYPAPNIKAKLLHMPAEQLKIYFEVHQWSQDDIIKCAPLYQSDEFIKFLKMVTEYSVIIRTLHETCSNASRMQKFLWILQNKYYKGFIKRLAYLKQQQELQEKEHARIARQKTLEQKQQASSQDGIIQTLNKQKILELRGKTRNNIDIEIKMTRSGKIVTAYPIF